MCFLVVLNICVFESYLKGLDTKVYMHNIGSMGAVWLCLLCIVFYIGFIGCCTWGDDEARCDAWGPCSHSCGGGTRKRKCYSCAWGISKEVTESCNEHCYNRGTYSSGRCHCTSWRYGTCCNSCRHIYIAHCVSGHQECGGSPDGIKCTQCEDPYYPAGYGNGCRECSAIANCKFRSCTTTPNTICKECVDNNVFFKRTTADTKCERMCSFNNHYCWPGSCGDSLTDNCKCAPGFTLTGGSWWDSQTTCQPSVKPVIETCRTTVSDRNGDKVAAESSSESTACQYLQDMYGNFQPTMVAIDMASSILLNTSNTPRPKFISDETLLGLTDTSVKIEHRDITGRSLTVSQHPQLTDNSQGTNARPHYHSKDNIAVAKTLTDGEWLCIVFESWGGGYFRSIDFRTATVSSPVSYRKTHQTRKVCYRYDDSAPIHCQEDRSCAAEPLILEKRVTRAMTTKVAFDGWFDPIPKNGKIEQASQIESYGLTVNEVIPAGETLKVDTASVFTTKVDHSIKDITLTLDADTPRLYCIILEAKDNAHNVQHARRFMLYDNTSFIEKRDDHQFKVTSASPNTNFLWQTHHNDICMNWKDHFINLFYSNNKLLNPIESDPHGLISGIYDQITGELPVSGTSNIHGIINFYISWSLNSGAFTNEIAVPDFLNQSYCNDFAVRDGQTYTFNIRPIDIAGNTNTTNTTVHIDSSAPHINNIWLTKDGYHSLFVHHVTDLSKMDLYFEVIDSHSGIRNIEWTFGISDTATELTSGVLASTLIAESNCPDMVTTCYCPHVGQCEFFNYTVPLNKLVEANTHLGNHNRNYYFTIRATNNALLITDERIEVLVDDSPPEVGVVYEGPLGSNDIDYTSEDSFLVHWHGFIDHESGIRTYRIGLASRCLGKGELYNKTTIEDIEYYEELQYTESLTRVPANFVGRRYLSVIALNNAMDPSDVVCSDGIIRDILKPDIRNVTLQHASWSSSIACHNSKVWLLQHSLTKTDVSTMPSCNQVCDKQLSEKHSLIDALPSSDLVTETVNICRNALKYHGNIIYLPNDHIQLSWNVNESFAQIKEYLIGIGTDPSEIQYPLVEDYIPTGLGKHFRRQHEGIGAGNMVYIFIKAVNRAHMENVVVLGPIIIDETPPLNNGKPTVEITNTDIVVSWDKDTFYDLEQTEQIDNIFFQIGCEQRLVSPLLQWKLESSETCPSATGGCFKYPLQTLQEQDTDAGHTFFFNMHVHNRAGHSLEIKTEPFELPSRYPPAHAVVKDIDPKFKDNQEQAFDIDVHFTDMTVCAKWSGFTHHEHVSTEIGIGTDDITDNIEPFRHIDNNGVMCLASSNIKYNTKYYVLIRASSSGGPTISSSNGVTIVDSKHATQSLIVDLGPDCSIGGFLKTNSTSIILHQVQSHNDSIISFTFHSIVGLTYRLLRLSNECVVSSNDGILSNVQGDGLNFVPFIDNPILNLECQDELPQPSDVAKLFIQSCPKLAFREDITLISAHWFSQNNTLPKGIVYQTAIVESINNSNTSDSYYLITPYIEVGGDQSHYFGYMALRNDAIYRVYARLCSKDNCLDPVFSEALVYQEPPSGDITLATLYYNTDAECNTLEINWNSSSISGSILFYQWTVCKDEEHTHCLGEWETVVAKGNNSLQVKKCANIPVHPHSTLYVCVRVFTGHDNDHKTVCRKIDDQLKGTYDLSEIYEFDASSEDWDNMKQMISSSNLGDMYATLHNNDVNSIRATTPKIAGVILYAFERNVSWYLMSDKHVPDKCDLNKNCLVSAVTNTGFAIFNEGNLVLNSILYICAHANSTTVDRESFTEVFKEVKACGNGFVLDDVPPVAGTVEVRNTNGFVNNLHNIEVTWERFTDNVNASRLGYINNIKNYIYAIGSRPGADDIRQFTVVGIQRKVIDNKVNVPDGSEIVVTIRGEDLAGNTADAVSAALVVDTSPPQVGRVHSGKLVQELENGRHDYISTNSFTIYMTEFIDNESGILEYHVGIGTQPYVADIVSDITCQDNYKDITLADFAMYDGHTLFVLVKARNRAGLDSQYISHSFVVDRSPPFGGHVLDGHWENEVDMDYQSDLTTLHGHWKGFIDEHSGIAYYRVGLGTYPFTDNIDQFIDVGLHTDISFYGTYIAGTTYYVTVEACNGAGMCSTGSSDGITLDNSPPTSGVVVVGFGGQHHKYQSHSTFVHVQWEGFEDPQSGINNYEACIGSSPGQCDIVANTNCLLRDNMLKSDLDLPINLDLFATVLAHNPIGMNASQVSDTFRVDVSPPQLLTKPHFLVDFTSTSGKIGQWDKSLIHLLWEFTDDESPITKHEITLVTHHEGHSPIQHKTIGSENQLLINLDHHSWLHDGDTYYAVVTSCNSAGLCQSATSDQLLVDSTPPHQGGLREPLTWNNFKDMDGTLKANISLNWYGFHDQESGIDRYFIAVGRTYNGYELSDGVLSVDASPIKGDYSSNFILTTPLGPDDKIVLTIWAENSVGLNSSADRVTMDVLTASIKSDLAEMEGVLEIKKHSCDLHFCNKDCTCAVLGQPCAASDTNMTCSETHPNGENKYPSVTVVAGFHDKVNNITSSSACLAGSWQVEHTIDVPIERFEWSLGIYDQPVGEGVFDIKSEIPWMDVGHRTEAVHCLPTNKSLIHDEFYVIYVRVWYDSSAYAVFNSYPVQVDHTPPAVRRGRFIKDSTELCQDDYDIIDWTDTISACWNDVVSEQQGHIEYYLVSLGTDEHADCVYSKRNVGLNTSINVHQLSMKHGTKYFFTVTAYNSAGLHTSVSSDGFIIDTDKPSIGVAFNTVRHTNSAFQSTNVPLSISWHGFQDTHSGIKSYFTTMTTDLNTAYDLFEWEDVNIKTQHVFKDIPLLAGETYYGLVRAIDYAGHWSDVATTPGITMDNSSPKGVRCEHWDSINATVAASDSHIGVNVLIYDTFHDNTLLKIEGDFKAFDYNTKLYIVVDRHRYEVPIKYHHGDYVSFSYPISVTESLTSIEIEIQGSYQDMNVNVKRCVEENEDNDAAVTLEQLSTSLVSVHALIIDRESSIKKINIGLGTTPGGLQVSKLVPMHLNSQLKLLPTNVPHGTSLYATIIATNRAGLQSIFHARPIIMDHTPPLVTDLTVSVISESHNDSSNSTVNVHAEWNVADEESGFSGCFCRLGSEQFMSDIQPDWHSDTPTSCIAPDINVHHGDTMYLTLICGNNVQLYTKVYSEPIVISTQKPNTDFASVHFNQLNEMSAPFEGSLAETIQSNRTCLELSWKNFNDITGNISYEYQIHDDNGLLVPWTKTGTRDIVARNDLQMHRGLYTAYVRAINAGSMVSDLISASILVHPDPPKLTGRAVTINRHGAMWQLDWSKVFDTVDGVPYAYSLTIGTRRGFTDVADIDYISTGHYDFTVPNSTLVSLNPHRIYVEIVCTFSTGLSSTYLSTYGLH